MVAFQPQFEVASILHLHKHKFIITVFQDKKLLKTASTLFKIDNLDTMFETPFEALETNVQLPSMQLNDLALNYLLSYPKADMIKLATML